MDSSFIDLDILLTRIREPRSKVYFLDAVKAYKAGALRAALSSAWVVVVYDLISKYRELDAVGDAAPRPFLQSWDNARANDDKKKLLELERSIIDDATKITQILSPMAAVHMERLLEDRHLCAHPAYSTEAALFEPSPELVRLHLVNAIDLVLSQQPLQGRAIIDQFGVDVQSTGFPTATAKILDYIDQRYLARIRPQNIRNFGVVLAKSLLKGQPAEWEKYRHKIAASLIAVRERSAANWPDIFGAITQIIDALDPQNRLRAVSFLAIFPDFWPRLENPTRTALQETVAALRAADIIDYSVLSGIGFPQFRAPFLAIIDALTDEQLANAIAVETLPELWTRALQTYAGSTSYRDSESNFREYIVPFAGQLKNAQLDELLDAIARNDQNWAAHGTPELLLSVLKNTAAENLPTNEARDRFFRWARRNGRGHYDDVIALFQESGWNPPGAE